MKEIITEIERVKMLMGLNPVVLLESTGGEILDRVANRILQVFEKATEIRPGIIKLLKDEISKSDFDAIVLALTDKKYFDLLSDVQKRILSKVITSIDETVLDVYIYAFGLITKNNNLSERQLLERIISRLDDPSGPSIKEVLQELTGDEFLTDILWRKTMKKVEDLRKGIFTPEIKRGYGIDPTTGLPWEAPKIIDNMQKTPWETASDTVYELFRPYEQFWMMYIRKWYVKVLPALVNSGKIRETSLLAAKRHIQKAYKLQESGKSPVSEMEQALVQILLSKTESDMPVDEIIKTFITENKGLSEEFKRLLLNPETDRGKKLKKLISDINAAENDNLQSAFGDEFRSFAELFTGTLKSSKTSQELQDDIKLPRLRRLFWLTAWRDPRGPWEIITAMAKRGVKREVTARLISYLLFSTFLFPWLKSSFTLFYQKQFKGKLELEKMEAFSYICEEWPESFNDEFCDEVNKRKEELTWVKDGGYWESWLRTLPLGIGDAILGEKLNLPDWPGAEQFLINSVFYKTYSDEVIKNIGSVIEEFIAPLKGKPNTQRFMEMISILDQDSKKRLSDLGFDPSASEEEQIAQLRKIYMSGSMTPEERKTAEEVFANTTPIEEIKKEDILESYPCITDEDRTLEYGETLGFPNGVWYVATKPDENGEIKRYPLLVQRNEVTKKIEAQWVSNNQKLTC